MSHLSVVVDLSPVSWQSSALSLPLFLDHLLVFLNAHVAARHDNSLALFAALPASSVLLYSSQDALIDSVSNPNSYPPFNSLDASIVARVISELEAHAEKEAPCALVGAITKALCHVNRVLSASPTDKSAVTAEPPDPRILILSVSPDLTTSYIPFMNAIFSAQKLKVTIDACQLYGQDAVFLQQAAHLTGGSFLLLERRDALLQYLIACINSSILPH